MVKTCHSCPHLRSCLVAGLDEKGLQKISDSLRRYSVQGKGRALFNQGEPVAAFFFLCDGTVKLTHVLRNGDEVILDVKTASSTLGKYKTPQQQSHFQSIVTASDSVDLGYIQADILQELLRDNPAFLQGLLNHLEDRSEIIYKRLACMKLRLRDRLLCLIALTLPAKEREEIVVPFSNIELAQLAQTTPETISRTIHQLKAKGRVDISVAGSLKIKKRVLQEYLDQLA